MKDQVTLVPIKKHFDADGKPSVNVHKNKKALPSSELLGEMFSIDHNTGILRWRPRPRSHFGSHRGFDIFNSRYPGAEAGTENRHAGYRMVNINKQLYYTHRIIWKLKHGRDPVAIDHINGNSFDNRMVNLREADQRENSKNNALLCSNTSGQCGVYLAKANSKWVAQIKVDGKQLYLGGFDQIEDAIACRKAAESAYGFHPNHGRLPAAHNPQEPKEPL